MSRRSILAVEHRFCLVPEELAHLFERYAFGCGLSLSAGVPEGVVTKTLTLG